MKCEEYRDWVAATADGRADEQGAAAAAHVEGCASCRLLEQDQVAVRRLLRSRSLLEPAPIGLETRIRSRLEEEGSPSRGFGALRAGLLAFAVAGLVLAFVPRGVSGELADVAESLRLAERTAVAIPADEPAELGRRYADRLDRGEPARVLDLAPALRLVGGTIREIHGAPARVTTYRAGEGRVVCHFVPVSAWSALAERLERGSFTMTVEGIHFMVSRAGDEICILASRLPRERFRAAVGAA